MGVFIEIVVYVAGLIILGIVWWLSAYLIAFFLWTIKGFRGNIHEIVKYDIYGLGGIGIVFIILITLLAKYLLFS
jgi:hypothetical protein